MCVRLYALVLNHKACLWFNFKSILSQKCSSLPHIFQRWTHTRSRVPREPFFFSSLRLVFLCSRRQQNLQAVPGDTAELTDLCRCRWIWDVALLFQSAGVRSPVAQPRWNYRRRCTAAIVTLCSERPNSAVFLCCNPAAKKCCLLHAVAAVPLYAETGAL